MHRYKLKSIKSLKVINKNIFIYSFLNNTKEILKIKIFLLLITVILAEVVTYQSIKNKILRDLTI